MSSFYTRNLSECFCLEQVIFEDEAPRILMYALEIKCTVRWHIVILGINCNYFTM